MFNEYIKLRDSSEFDFIKNGRDLITNAIIHCNKKNFIFFSIGRTRYYYGIHLQINFERFWSYKLGPHATPDKFAGHPSRWKISKQVYHEGPMFLQ